MPSIRAAFLAASLAAATIALAQPASYKVIDLGALSLTGTSEGMAVSEVSPAPTPAGLPRACGSAAGANAGPRPFTWSPKTGMVDGAPGNPGSGIARDINAAGHHVGQFTFATGSGAAPRGYFSGGSNAALIPLATLGGKVSTAHAFNGSATIAGAAQTAAGEMHACTWTINGIAPKDLGTLGGKWSTAYGIGDDGTVVGQSQNKDGLARAFVWQPVGPTPGGGMTDLGSLSPKGSSIARDINAKGVIVGQSQAAALSNIAEFRAVLWEGNSIKNLGTLSNTHHASEALAINSHGHIVGWSGGAALASPMPSPSPKGVDRRAFIWADGKMADLNGLIPAASGWELVVAADINDHGHIVGWGFRGGNTTPGKVKHAFMLVPEGP